jgi:integrase
METMTANGQTARYIWDLRNRLVGFDSNNNSNLADAGSGLDVVADLLGHASITSSQVYVHPDPSRLRAAVDAVPSPRAQAGVAR